MKAKYVCTKGRARKAIVGLWITSIFLAVPILIGRVRRCYVSTHHSVLMIKRYSSVIVENPICSSLYLQYIQCIQLPASKTFIQQSEQRINYLSAESLPIIFQIHLTFDGKRRTATWCVKYFYDPVVRRLYELYMFCVILLIPVVIMTFAYFRICQELWFMTKHRQSLRSAAYVASR